MDLIKDSVALVEKRIKSELLMVSYDRGGNSICESIEFQTFPLALHDQP